MSLKPTLSLKHEIMKYSVNEKAEESAQDFITWK
jgi:hypothetical protein